MRSIKRGCSGVCGTPACHARPDLCDADLNNDGITSVVDLGIFRQAFFADNADADFNGDGVVNVVDLVVKRQ